MSNSEESFYAGEISNGVYRIMKLFIFETCRRALSLDFRPGKPRRGQTTIEYVLMLASIIGGCLIFAALFYKKLLGGFFTVVGLVIGAGTPT